jgi:hypothetical protein
MWLAWLSSAEQQMIAFQQAFNVFVFERVVPLFFTLPLSADFRPVDAQCSLVCALPPPAVRFAHDHLLKRARCVSTKILGEMARMQKTLVERCGQDALHHVRNVVCQIPNCTQQATEEYMQQLLQPLKAFDPFYKASIPYHT